MAQGPTPDPTLPPVPKNMAKEFAVADPEAVQASVTLAEEVGMTRSIPITTRCSWATACWGAAFYATRLYHDLRQVRCLV